MMRSYADGQPLPPEQVGFGFDRRVVILSIKWALREAKISFQMGGLDDSVGASGGSAMALHNFMAGLHHPQSQQGSPASMALSMSTSSSASMPASTSSAEQHHKLQLGQGDASDGNRSPPASQSASNDGSSSSTPASSQGHPLLALQGHLPPHFSSTSGRFLSGENFIW